MNSQSLTKKISDNKEYVIIFSVIGLSLLYFAVQYSAYYAAYPNADFITVFIYTFKGISKYPFSLPKMPSLGTFIIMLVIYAFIGSFVYVTAKVRSKAEQHAKSGTENGTAEWNKDLNKWNKVYTDPKDSIEHDGNRNMIMTQNVYLSMDTRQTKRNNNIIVIGGSGAGKSRYFVKPNLCEMPINCNFVCTDPSGELLNDVGTMLEGAGYKIKVFNLVNMKNSDKYNPFKYIHTENDVILLTDCILANTSDPNHKGGDDFWEKAQKLMFQAFIFLIWLHGDELRLKKNFNTLNMMMNQCQISEEESSNSEQGGQTAKYFEAIERSGWYFDDSGKFVAGRPPEGLNYEYHEPYGENDICVKQYAKFKVGAGKTLKSILISAEARLSLLDVSDVASLLEDDDIDIDKIGDEKTALFIIIPQDNKSFNFFAAMLYTQLFQSLYFHAGNECQGNYIVMDNNGENIKTFEIAHNDVDIHDFDDEEEAEEFEFDLTKGKVVGEEDNDEEEVVIEDKTVEVKKKNRKKKKKDTIPEKPIQSDTSILEETGFEYNKEQKLPDDDPGAEDKNVEKIAQDFAERLSKNIKCVKKGNKFILKLPGKNSEDEDEIVGIYGNQEFALKRFNAIKAGCSVRRCGLYLPYHVRFLLDEFANIGQIPDFNEKLATMRKYEISCSVILQNLAQIKNMYKDDWGTLIGNCDSLLFLGCPEFDTQEYISKKLGKQTITTRNRSSSKGQKGSTSFSYNQSGRELATPDELGRMENDECIYLLRGEQPFKDKKYNFEGHPNYKYTADKNKENLYKFRHKSKKTDEDDSTYPNASRNNSSGGNARKINDNYSERSESTGGSSRGNSFNADKYLSNAKDSSGFSFTEQSTTPIMLADAMINYGANQFGYDLLDNAFTESITNIAKSLGMNTPEDNIKSDVNSDAAQQFPINGLDSIAETTSSSDSSSLAHFGSFHSD